MVSSCQQKRNPHSDNQLDQMIRGPIKSQRFRGTEYRCMIVSVHSYREDVLCGTVFNPFFVRPKQFKSATQLVRIINEALDDMKGTDDLHVMSGFSSPRGIRMPRRAEFRGEMATFYVRVLFRQNTSWQGELIWSEAKKTVAFRSVLELLLLMDSALHSIETEQD